MDEMTRIVSFSSGLMVFIFTVFARIDFIGCIPHSLYRFALGVFRVCNQLLKGRSDETQTILALIPGLLSIPLCVKTGKSLHRSTRRKRKGIQATLIPNRCSNM
jgi:hypothetical protein